MIRKQIILAHIVKAMLDHGEEVSFPQDVFDFLGDNQNALEEFFLGEDGVIDPLLKAKEVIASFEARDYHMQKVRAEIALQKDPVYQAGFEAGNRVDADVKSCPYKYEVPTHSSVQKIIDANELVRKNYKLWQRGFNDGYLNSLI